ncbi:YibE/F family protein [Mobilitalea sibirica]|nr:YibE/F family protein [Mobilitalea sibirica]
MDEKLKGKVLHQLPVIVSLLLLIILLCLPTGYEGALLYQDAQRCRVKVLKTDNDTIVSAGLIKTGEQLCTVELLNGKFKGRIVEAVNMLNGSMEKDKIYSVGDKAMIIVSHREDKIISASMIDIYRIDKEIILAGIFVVFLILFAGKTGIRAILSFIVTVLMLWKILIPGYLGGTNPVILGFIITAVLTIVIISLVYGFDRRAASAIAGAMLGIITTLILGVVFTDLFQIHGAVMAYSESLLYSGYMNLNLTQIFMSGIFIGASGAVMDLAVDITSSVHEVVGKKKDIRWKEATLSGIRVGRASVGTMTTTLLLAYSGGYIALLMVFMAQGTPIYNILNLKYVAAEILDTMVGSIGLVTVAPFTALTSGMMLTRGNK